MMRIGIFSGTFDPVHAGHVAFCKAALAEAHLDRIMLLPEASPRGKVHVTPLKHRLAMLRLAVADEPRLCVLRLPDRQFAVKTTLPELVRRFAGHELALLLGSDVIPSMCAGWPALEELLARMELVVGIRAGVRITAVEQAIAKLQASFPASDLRYTFVIGEHAHAASSHIRSMRHLAADLIPSVAGYIASHELYLTAGKAL